jgi:hypothetical protein
MRTCPLSVLHCKVKKGKAVPVEGRGGPWGCGTLGLPHFLNGRLTDDGGVIGLRAGRPLPPGRLLVLVSDGGRVDLRAIMWRGGGGDFYESSYLVGGQARDLPACGMMPQPTTLLRGPSVLHCTEHNKAYEV